MDFGQRIVVTIGKHVFANSETWKTKQKQRRKTFLDKQRAFVWAGVSFVCCYTRNITPHQIMQRR